MKPTSRVLFRILVLPLVFALSACGGGEHESEPAAADTTDTMAATVDTATVARININTATDEEMHQLPGVGERMVHEFEEYRPYVSIQQFRREIGKYVDEATVAGYERYIFVPVNPNESDAETLQQLPGIDANEAQELIAGRPYDSRDAFMEKLASYASGEDLATAETYLAE